MKEQALGTLKSRESALKERLAEARRQLEQATGEVLRLRSEAKETFRANLQSENKRNELTSFKLEVRGKTPRMQSHGEPNLSAVTQNTNFNYRYGCCLELECKMEWMDVVLEN